MPPTPPLRKQLSLEPGDAEVLQIQSRLAALLGNLDEAVYLGEQQAVHARPS
jgi:hypothetical protein